MPRPLSLLEALEEKRNSFVHVKRTAPWINLRRKGMERSAPCLLHDVGTDFIEIGIGNSAPNQMVTRAEILEVQFVGGANG